MVVDAYVNTMLSIVEGSLLVKYYYKNLENAFAVLRTYRFMKQPMTLGWGDFRSQKCTQPTGITSSTERCHPPKCVCHDVRNVTSGADCVGAQGPKPPQK